MIIMIILIMIILIITLVKGGYGFQKGVGIFSTPSRSIRSAFPENMNFNWDRLNHWKPRKGPGFWKR